MAQSEHIVGTEFTVTIGVDLAAVEVPFNKVSMKMSAKPVERSNSKYTPGFTVIKGGRKQMTLSLEGPYMEGEFDFTVGEEYTVNYTPNATLAGWTALFILLDHSHENDGDDGPRLTLDLQSQSDFVPLVSGETVLARDAEKAPRAGGRGRGRTPAPVAPLEKRGGVNPPVPPSEEKGDDA